MWIKSAKIYCIIFPVFIISLVKVKITLEIWLTKINNQGIQTSLKYIEYIVFSHNTLYFLISHIIETPNSSIEDYMEEIIVNR